MHTFEDWIHSFDGYKDVCFHHMDTQTVYDLFKINNYHAHSFMDYQSIPIGLTIKIIQYNIHT